MSAQFIAGGGQIQTVIFLPRCIDCDGSYTVAVSARVPVARVVTSCFTRRRTAVSARVLVARVVTSCFTRQRTAVSGSYCLYITPSLSSLLLSSLLFCYPHFNSHAQTYSQTHSQTRLGNQSLEV